MRHETVSHLIRVNIRIILIVSLETADQGIEGFGIIFRDIKLNTGGIEGKHGGKGSVDGLTDGFGIIHHLLEHEFNVVCKTEFEACKKRSIRDFEKPQKSLSSLQIWSRRIRRESVGIEKIFWRMRAERKAVRG